MEFAKEALSTSSGERVMTIAEQLLEEGMVMGRNEGLTIGRNEGLTIGRNEGEEKASLEIAANLLRDGHPPEAVA